MFCKYCGGDLSVGQRNCGRCGADVGVKSDCGGFYDLVQVQPPAAPVTPVMPAPQPKKTGPWIPVLLAIVGVLLILVVVLVLQQGGLTEEIESLQNEIEELQEETAARETTEETTGETAEEQETAETIIVTLPDLFDKEKSETEGQTEPVV